MSLNNKELDEFNKEMDEVFEEPKKTKPKKDKSKKLKVIGWIAFTISFIGIILNAWKIIWCWPIWCIANIFWIYWATKKKEGAQVFLWSVFTLANIYGWYLWATM